MKANIPVEKSVVLLGICDPTFTLEHDQIFLQVRQDSFSRDIFFQDPNNKELDLAAEIAKSQLIQGNVIVGRSPCVLPSEIRTLKAVDARKTMGHLVNVVVFSAKPFALRAKPVYALMGGGDLDGDTYWVCWDSELTDSVREIDRTQI